MDFPPAIAVVAEVSRTLLGDSAAGIRLAPALLGAALVVLAGVIARELGGGRAAQGLAAFCVLTSPLFLHSANLLQPVVIDQVVWPPRCTPCCGSPAGRRRGTGSSSG